MDDQITKGRETFSQCYSILLKRNLVQYDYRLDDGRRFMIVASTLAEARRKRNNWIRLENTNNHG